MSYLDQARQMEEDCVSRCGEAPAFVYFMQWREGEAIKIGTASSVPGRMHDFAAGHPTPPILRCVAPGGQAFEHWFHGRHRSLRISGEWYDPAEPVIADGQAFREQCELAFSECADAKEARVRAIRALDPALADLEAVYRNGMPVATIADMAGLGVGTVRSRVNHLRALGFDVRYRRTYASRSPRYPTRNPYGTRLIG